MKRFRTLINPFGDLLFCTFFHSVDWYTDYSFWTSWMPVRSHHYHSIHCNRCPSFRPIKRKWRNQGRKSSIILSVWARSILTSSSSSVLLGSLRSTRSRSHLLTCSDGDKHTQFHRLDCFTTGEAFESRATNTVIMGHFLITLTFNTSRYWNME